MCRTPRWTTATSHESQPCHRPTKSVTCQRRARRSSTYSSTSSRTSPLPVLAQHYRNHYAPRHSHTWHPPRPTSRRATSQTVPLVVMSPTITQGGKLGPDLTARLEMRVVSPRYSSMVGSAATTSLWYPLLVVSPVSFSPWCEKGMCKGITPHMTVCSLATLTTKHSIVCLYMVLYYDERRTTKLRT